MEVSLGDEEVSLGDEEVDELTSYLEEKTVTRVSFQLVADESG